MLNAWLLACVLLVAAQGLLETERKVSAATCTALRLGSNVMSIASPPAPAPAAATAAAAAAASAAAATNPSTWGDPVPHTVPRPVAAPGASMQAAAGQGLDGNDPNLFPEPIPGTVFNSCSDRNLLYVPCVARGVLQGRPS